MVPAIHLMLVSTLPSFLKSAPRLSQSVSLRLPKHNYGAEFSLQFTFGQIVV